ncbi:hypothetical protein RM550_35875 [Streptomyces sp. DSM 41527]|uniref:ABC-three component systems C-terminal domain-containing protein n=1 Tax=Streptomyces mooreae TaxID=3075523 RepID=A0ABU2TJE1_9ACTN|nr:ABC-three component system protein [Streptomyces sp. DSM 41527]MDT0461026.1 hypothetical protein [Streptomyces sp. DSM 41527]
MPITEAARRLTAAEIAAYDGHLVVDQMRWIGLKDRTIATHLRDYHYARAQRLEWIRTFKVTEEGLEEYERLLWDEGDHVFTKHTDDVEDGTPAADRKAIGKRVLDDTVDKVAVNLPAPAASPKDGSAAAPCTVLPAGQTRRRKSMSPWAGTPRGAIPGHDDGRPVRSLRRSTDLRIPHLHRGDDTPPGDGRTWPP